MCFFFIAIFRLLHNLDMQLVGRHYYNKHMPVKIPEHK